MTFRGARAAESTAGEWLVTGDVTLHGVTRPVELSLRFGDSTADAEAIRPQ